MAKDEGLLWKLPVLGTQHLGKVGPAFGFGVGCGVGFGIGLLGGIGFGPGIPGFQVAFGFGAGCGVGLGFGYGAGKGVARDQYRKYSNVGSLIDDLNAANRSRSSAFSASQEDIGALIDELVDNTKKLAIAASKEVDKWRK